MNMREAEAEDAARVAALITLAFRVEEFFVDGDRTTANAVRARMQHGAFLLMEDADRTLAGCIYVDTRGDRGYFGMLSIDPERQGRGLGRQLVTAAEERCRAAGCREMEIEVVNLRTELPPFYRRLGYTETGTRPFNQLDRAKLACHFIVMTKELT
jgi:ribosomal protein S18 acetylase RimI-like enzyme